MFINAKNSLSILFLAFLFLPFLFLTNFYPFMRFGMFAEPIRTSNPIYYSISINQTKTNSTTAFDVPEDVFQQWAHNYFSKGDTVTFYKKLQTIQLVSGDLKVVSE